MNFLSLKWLVKLISVMTFLMVFVTFQHVTVGTGSIWLILIAWTVLIYSWYVILTEYFIDRH